MERLEVKELMDKGTFEGEPIRGILEETNISWVILSRNHAFKIKKNIKLSFLDYSTLELRKQYCEKELELNRRFSEIYLSVQPLIYFQGSWVMGENKGEIKDYAVCMKRMATRKRLDVLLKNRDVETKRILLLSKHVARFHHHAKVMEFDFDRRKAKEIFNDLVTVQEIVSNSFGESFGKTIPNLISFSDRFLENHTTRLEERYRNGFVRDVHGDLHSGNIFLYQNPIIFDCIEFSDAFRQIDILYEIAFLCMDLEFFGRKDLSELFLETYDGILTCFPKTEDEAIFLYFKCLRANIRAKVFLLNSKTEPDPDKRTKELEKGKRYLDLAVSYQQKLQQGFSQNI
jgi:aminoglycoside phosphotransferase family enzyme